MAFIRIPVESGERISDPREPSPCLSRSTGEEKEAARELRGRRMIRDHSCAFVVNSYAFIRVYLRF